jgi:hypothetical protein
MCWKKEWMHGRRDRNNNAFYYAVEISGLTMIIVAATLLSRHCYIPCLAF